MLTRDALFDRRYGGAYRLARLRLARGVQLDDDETVLDALRDELLAGGSVAALLRIDDWWGGGDVFSSVGSGGRSRRAGADLRRGWGGALERDDGAGVGGGAAERSGLFGSGVCCCCALPVEAGGVGGVAAAWAGDAERAPRVVVGLRRVAVARARLAVVSDRRRPAWFVCGVSGRMALVVTAGLPRPGLVAAHVWSGRLFAQAVRSSQMSVVGGGARCGLCGLGCGVDLLDWARCSPLRFFDAFSTPDAMLGCD